MYVGSMVCTKYWVTKHCSFVRPEILEQLVRMVTLEPDEDAEDKVKFK